MKLTTFLVCVVATAFTAGCAKTTPTVSEPTPTATTQEDLQAKAKRLEDAQSKIPPPPSKTAYVDYGMISSGSEVYQWLLIKDSVSKVNHRVVSAKVIANYPEPKTEKGKKYLSAILELQLDCEDHKFFKIIAVEYFPKFYAKGAMLSRSDYQEQGISKWMTTGLDSPGARVSRSACHVISKQPATSKKNDEFLEMLQAEELFLKELKRDLVQTRQVSSPNTNLNISDKEKRLREAAGSEAVEKNAKPPNADEKIYQQQVRDKIQKYIKLPDGIEGNPRSSYWITLLPNGEVLSVKVAQSSGNTKLDEAVTRAIYYSSPFPTPEHRQSDRRIHLVYYPY